MSGAPTALSRWGWPAAVIWAGLMLSAWVHTARMPPGGDVPPLKLVALFLGAPALQVAGLVVLRRILDRRGAGRGAELMVLWLMTFLFGLHAAVLATAIGLLDSIGRAVPVAIGLLLFGVGPVLVYLEPGSPLGIRTKATLADPEAWRRAHHFAAMCFIVAGLCAPAGLLFEGVPALYVAITPALFAVAASILRASFARVTPPNEHPEGPSRPTDDASESASSRVP